MKVAKNKKSMIQNIAEVLPVLSEAQKKEFIQFSKRKRQNPKYLILFNCFMKLSEEGFTSEFINKKEISKCIKEKGSATDNIGKLAENLYANLLKFLAEKFKEDRWKKWQVEANQTLLEVEALADNKLYSQAIGHLLKLEENIKNLPKHKKYIYDDIGIFSRLSNLKVHLSTFKPDILAPDEMDEMLSNIIQAGDYFYINKKFRPNKEILEKQKIRGYQLLARYFIDEEEYTSAIQMLDREIEKVKNDYEYDDNNEQLDYLTYLYLIKHFASLKLGKFEKPDKLFILLKKDEKLLSFLLTEQSVFDSMITCALKNNEIKYFEEFRETNIGYGTLSYSYEKIESFEVRKELNYSIIMFVCGDYDHSLKILSELKKVGKVKSRKNPIYLSILFLELLALIQKYEYDLSYQIRNIESLIKIHPHLKFEKKAVVILKEFASLRKNERIKFVDLDGGKIRSLKKLKLDLEPLHHLILSIFYKNNIYHDLFKEGLF